VGSDGSVWFATTSGAVNILPPRAERREPPRTIILETMLADGKQRDLTRPIELAPGTQNVEFHYTSPSFVASDQIRYRYQLAAYDRDWIDAGTRGVAYYAHLPAGSYRFRVAIGQLEASVPFVLIPRFTETLAYRLIWSLVAMLIAVAIYMLRIRSLRVKHAAVLAERTRIAREFHDGLAQSLVGAGHQLDAAIDALGGGDDTGARHALDAARKLTRQSLSETRRSLLAMRPEVLERADLASAIGAISAHMREASGIAIEPSVSGTRVPLPPHIETHLLRIAQEALTNAVRHSGAQRISVLLHYDGNHVELSITDDGSGPRSLADSGPLRLGITGIRERAAEIGGRLNVSSWAGRGTTIAVVVPIGAARPNLATRIFAWSARR